MTEPINLLLSEVQQFDPTEYSRCRVHYNGIAGKGRDWAYKAGGDPFEFVITPSQAVLLSKLQDKFAGRKLDAFEKPVLLGMSHDDGVPQELINLFVSKGDYSAQVTGSAQVALYDLLR